VKPISRQLEVRVREYIDKYDGYSEVEDFVDWLRNAEAMDALLPPAPRKKTKAQAPVEVLGSEDPAFDLDLHESD
jgi:hypothetical protein